MRKHQSLQYILIFIVAQIAWLSLLGLWIYRYVTSYVHVADAGPELYRQWISGKADVLALVGGLVLLVAISVGMSLLYARLNSQLKITQLYDTFIANVTHELKSPLASIQLALETLRERRISRPKQQEFVRLMLQDTNRLNSLINAILEIAGLEQKKIAHRFEVHGADAVIRTLAREAAEQFQLPKRAFEIRGSAPCRCVADRDALKMVFNNIFDNAVKYSSGSPEIRVNYHCTSNTLTIDFKDRGIGIPSHDLKNIFKKFHRVHDRDAPSVKGTGLGLYWVREIIRHHGGRTSVFSDGKNRGSTFRVELPVYRPSKKNRINRLLEIARQMPRQPDGKDGDSRG
ncbi:HAMP domain-containing histidine kinase [bacterium]|nr:HAMP domain-containing histidine kinase [bacterium]